MNSLIRLGRTLELGPEEPIAIIGAACRLPGAEDLEAFDRLLAAAGDSVSEVPDCRWSKARHFHPKRGTPGKSYTFAAGVLQQVDRFDAGFFGISPREAAQVDPQQRLLLELAYETFEDAGSDAAKLAGTQTAVFIGASSWDYTSLHMGDPAISDAYSMTGSAIGCIANRISYAFDLRGPSLTIDTACSSALVALHQACEALRSRQVPMALVGAVNLLLSPHSFVGFSAASMLSPTGRCKPFAALADGYVRAEGAGIVMLQPLQEALASNACIRAVIHATGVNSDGRTTGLSLPNKASQVALLRETYARFRIDPNDLAFVEAHGTGTPAGDPIEAAALGEALGQERTSPLPIGSVKSNIGHLESASGIAGLLKTVLALERRRLPASIHAETLNPAIPFERLNLTLARDPLMLPAGAVLAGVNSFGFGGTNAHAVLGSAPVMPREPAIERNAEPHLITAPLLLSARSANARRMLAEKWRDMFDGKRVCSALVRGAAHAREHSTYRLIVSAGQEEELKDRINNWLAGHKTHDVVEGDAVFGRVAFVFSGNGSQWAGMGLDAVHHSRAFANCLDKVSAMLEAHLGWSIVATISAVDADSLADTRLAQPLLFALQVATTEALRAAGVQACTFMGHSVGEVAAAWAAGALTLEQACLVVAVRSRLQAETAGGGRMGVLALNGKQAAQELRGTGLEIAARNAASIVTIAGPAGALAQFAQRAERESWPFTELPLDYAFHSRAMEPIRDRLLVELDSLHPPSCPASFISTVIGAELPQGAKLDARYWWRNIREPVAFADAAQSMVDKGVRIFIEIGPQPVLQSYLQDALRQRDVDGRVLSSLGKRSAGRRNPIDLIAMRCYAAGCDIRGAAALAGPFRYGELPSYPWQRERYWLSKTIEALQAPDDPPEHPLLGTRRDRSEPSEWLCHLGTSLQAWGADHAIGGSPVLPAAAFLEMALAAGNARHPGARVLEVLDFEIPRAMSLEPEILRESRVRVTAMGAKSLIEVASRVRFSDDAWTVHATGSIMAGSSPSHCRGVLPPLPDGAVHLAADDLYQVANDMGLTYGPAFRSVDRLWHSVDLLGVDVRLLNPVPMLDREAGYLLPPSLLDGAFQSLLALAAELFPAVDRHAMLPWRFGRLRLLRADSAVPSVARTRVKRVGPRSVCADIVMLDRDGAVVVEAFDCWFTRVRVAAEPSGTLDHLFYTATEISQHPDRASSAARLQDAALGLATTTQAVSGPSDAVLLVDAFAAAASEELIRGLVQPDAAFDAESVGAGGEAGRRLFDQMMGWLERDDLAQREGRSWRLTGRRDASSEDILRTLAFEVPGAAAEATLLAWAADGLLARLRDGTGPDPALPMALAEQFFHATPAAKAAMDALVDAVHAVVERWPADQPLRVLQLGARQGLFTRHLLREAAVWRADLRMDVATNADDYPRLDETLAPYPHAKPIAWPLHASSAADGRYDLVIGYCAVATSSSDHTDLADLKRLAPGATILMVEPGPSRSWSLIWPRAAERPQGAEDACRVLAEAGAIDPAASPVSASWPAVLLTAVLPRVPSLSESRLAVSLVFEEGASLAQAVLEALAAHSALVSLVPAADLQATLARWQLSLGAVPATVVVLVPEAGSAAIVPWLDRLARIARAMPNDGQLVVLVRGGPIASPAAAAVAGLLRVITNEYADLNCRLLRLAPDLTDVVAAGRVAEELEHPDGECHVSWTGSTRLVSRVRLGQPMPAQPPFCGALRLSVAQTGRLDTLGWDPAPAMPVPASGQVTLRVRAAGLNFRDVMWSLGLLPDEALLDGFTGATLGLECAGEIEAIGEDVIGLQLGDRVMAFCPAAMASYAVTSSHAVMRIPDEMSFTAAATLPVAFLTAAYALGHLARLQAGERILIHGGAGGVGLAAIQYARLRGATIYATAGSAPKRALLRRLGVEAVFDSRTVDFADAVMRQTGGQGVDVVLNSLSGEPMERSLGVLRPFGRFLELGKRDFYENTRIGLRPLRHNVSYFAVDADQLSILQPKLAAALFAEISGLIETRDVAPLPFCVFDADAVVDAFRLMQTAGHVGKIVLDLANPRPRKAAVARQAATFNIHSDRTYLVTGGLSGFGLETARWLARRGARYIAMLGRRGMATPGADLAFSDFGAINVHASAIQCDVGDQASLESALASIRRTMPPLVGIFHAAVVIDDKLIPDVTEGHFADMMRVKVGGVEALDRLTRRDKIELFVAFSSVTTVLGSPGQASYVAANAAVEAVVEQRHRDGLPGIAVRWGPIADAGYLAREQALAQLLSVALGGNMLRASEALDALPLMLATGLPVIGLADIDWGRLSDSLKLMCSSEFDGLSRSGERPPNIREVRDFVINSSFSEAHSRLVELLTTEVARIMKMSVTDIGPHSPLSQLGMDSLMAVELRLAVEKGFGVTVPVLSLSEGATVSALAARMTRAIKRVDGGEDAVVVGVDATGMAGGDIALDYVAAQMERFEGARLVPAADALVVPTDDAR